MLKPRFFFTVLILACVSAGFTVHAQYAFAVFFKDKAGTPYTIASPGAYLSTRAIDRRNAQGIAIDSTDLPVSPKYIDSVIANTHGKIYETSKWLNLCVVMVYDSASILNLAGKSFIDSIDLVGFYDTLIYLRKRHSLERRYSNVDERTTTGDGAYYNYTWVQTNQIQGNCLHDNGYNGAGKLIAVLDAGFYGANIATGFDSMWAGGRVVDMHNFTYDTDFVFGWDNHGTNVLSTMAGYVPDTFVGAAPLASYALYVTEYDPNDQPVELINLLAGAERADSVGADVITESLGYDLFLNPANGMNFATDLDGKTTYAARAANIATRKGILFVATAGNDGRGFTFGGRSWGNHISTPGDADSALTVGAVDAAGGMADFSGYGPNAAGVVKPDICALGRPGSIINYAGTGSSEYTTEDGTSFSTPIIAGFAACLWEEFPSATPFQLRHAIDKSASQYTTPTNQGGYGIPNFCIATNLLELVPTITPEKNQWFTAYPNPFTTNLNFSVALTTSQEVNISITDVLGRFIYNNTSQFQTGKNSPVLLQLSAIPCGMYFLKATASGNQIVLKVVKE